jgi:RHS repeat-associated protein
MSRILGVVNKPRISRGLVADDEQLNSNPPQWPTTATVEGYWRFEAGGKTVPDSSGHGLDGQPVGAPELVNDDGDGDGTVALPRGYGYFYDANGNVGQMLETTADGGFGTLAAEYEYDPYGNALRSPRNAPASGAYAASNPFRFSTKYFDGELDWPDTHADGMYYYGYRYYEPKLGRFTNRDPFGELGGLGLYAFAINAPTYVADLLGLWGEDMHYRLVLELASLAGICCPEEIAKYANEPDTDYRRPGLEGLIDAAGFLADGPLGLSGTIWKLWIMGKWHFPRSANGEVERDSAAARKLMVEGLAEKEGGKGCDLRRFANGLHTYQDSWSHRGKPYLLGWVGHAFGAEEIMVPMFSSGGFPVMVGSGQYRLLTGREAALSSSIDEPNLFPDQARATARATYEWLKRFKASCPDACPERCDGTRTVVKHSWFFGGWREHVMTKKTDCGPARNDEADELIRTKWRNGGDVVPTP